MIGHIRRQYVQADRLRVPTEARECQDSCDESSWDSHARNEPSLDTPDGDTVRRGSVQWTLPAKIPDPDAAWDSPATSISVFCGGFLQVAYNTGYTSNSMANEVARPPTSGAAMRFMMPDPVPFDSNTGSSP